MRYVIVSVVKGKAGNFNNNLRKEVFQKLMLNHLNCLLILLLKHLLSMMILRNWKKFYKIFAKITKERLIK